MPPDAPVVLHYHALECITANSWDLHSPLALTTATCHVLHCVTRRADADRIQAFHADAKEKSTRRTNAFGNLMRSKGFVWQASSHDMVGYYSQAGSTVTLESPGTWKVLDAKAWSGPYKERMAFRKQAMASLWLNP